MPPELRFTTSWDDGHPLDGRLGELLARRGFPAAFYVTTNPAGGRPVMSPQEIRSLAQRFEIGGHTLDHPDLSQTPHDLTHRQITENKARLEAILGREAPGFCFPWGRHSALARTLVQQAGYRYARTTRPFFLDPGPDPFLMPVTAQCYPHPWTVRARQWLRHDHRGRRWGMARALTTGDGLLNGLTAALELALRQGGVFHLWGHSWELEAQNLWNDLDAFLVQVAERIPPSHRIAPGEVFAPGGGGVERE